MYHFNFAIIFMLSILVGCSSKKDIFELPLNRNNVWYYDVQGFRSGEKFAPPRPKLLDSLGSEAYLPKKIPERDTIRVFIKEIKELGKDSTLFKFSEDLVRFWGSEILLVKDGYKRYFRDYGEPYLIKFPVRLHNTWKNLFPLTSENCEIVSIDTTITFDGHEYHNCLGVQIRQSREGVKYFIETYFSEKYGLIYYVDHDSNDEIRLLRMQVQ